MNYLEGESIKLRAAEPEDLDTLYQWENDTRIWQVSNTIEPFSRFILKQYLENAPQDIYEKRQLRLMIDRISDRKTIGTIDLFDFEPYHLRAGVGILIGSGFRGNRYAREAMQVLIRYAFEVIQLHQLYCNISETNEASLKLFQNAGFEITGKKKEWIKSANEWVDEYFLQLLRK